MEFGVVDFAEFEGTDVFAAEVAAEDGGVEKAGELGEEGGRWAVDAWWYWGGLSIGDFGGWVRATYGFGRGWGGPCR